MKKLPNTPTLIIMCLVIIGLSSSLTYLLAPEKIKIKKVEVEKVVEIEKVVVVEKEVEKKRVTTEKEILPDGTIKEKVVEETLTKTEVAKSEEALKEKETLKASSKEVGRKKKNWAIQAGVLVKPLFLERPTYYGSVQRRVLGDIYIGVIGTSDMQIGFNAGFRF